ncbi:hydrolase activity protein [Halocaridina rubra]|uniref:Hydrolase activity protein n=1 Tax=Halocaridina rubra TaxID=373956 RepID=A0AAN8X571_HALRR
MRTFPRVWVPPGGHVEEGETFVEVGVRELKEETGIQLKPQEYVNCRVLGLWESVYPPVLYMGSPKRHHLVVYLHLKLDQNENDLHNRIKLDSNEVDACLWMTKNMAETVVYGSNSKPTEIIPITLVDPEGGRKSLLSHLCTICGGFPVCHYPSIL